MRIANQNRGRENESSSSLKTVDTFDNIVKTSTSVTVTFTGLGLELISLSIGIFCGAT